MIAVSKMSARDHGWPESYGWPEHLEMEIACAIANRAKELLRDDLAPLEDQDEQRRALEAWDNLDIPHTIHTSPIRKSIIDRW